MADAPWLRAMLDTYGGGDYAYLDEKVDGGLDGPHGDTLFLFLTLELHPDADCDSIEEAINRLNIAERDLREVREAIEAQWMEEDD